MPNAPLVSIVMPTYRRPQLLRRAVQSALAQTCADWELIVSDDENPPGPAWAYLQQVADADPRVRIVRNPGDHGQVPNVNFAMSQARGEWIKPLYDDDVLRPDCVERFLAAARGHDDVAVAACLTDRYRDGEQVRRARRGKRAAIERIERNHALLAMYYQDVEIGLPTQVMVRRTLVQHQQVTFAQPAGIRCGIDTWWYARLLQHGDLLLINEPLVEEHQGAHDTLTNSVSDEQFDEELLAFRRLIYPMLDTTLCPEPLSVVEQAMLLIRALYRLYRRRPLPALRMAMKVRRASAWRMGLRWLLRRVFPGSFHIVPRVAVHA